MFSNYPINDDWLFFRQVEAFHNKIIPINAELDPSFIFQGLLGFFWSKLFGLSFLNLQLLTFLVTGIATFGLLKILKHFNIKKSLKILVAILFLFNPLLFTSTFSFMTDNYFLCFLIWAVYFFLRYFDGEKGGEKLSNLLLASLFMLLSTLIRQIGIFTGIAFLLVQFKRKKFNRDSILVLFSIMLGLLIIKFYPRYGSNNRFIVWEAQFIFERMHLMLLALPYFLVLLFPLFFGLDNKVFRKKSLPALLVLFVPIAYYFYYFDFFPVGNVLFLESLHAKSDFRSNFSLFDNVFFKIILALFISLSLSKLLLFFIEKRKSLATEIKKLDLVDWFLILLFMLNFSIFFISSDFYDRYLLPCFFVTLLLFLKHFSSHLKINSVVIGSLVLLVLISSFLQWEFAHQNSLKWKIGEQISEDTGFLTTIRINGTFTQYKNAQKLGDFTGLEPLSGVSENRCFVQQYTMDSDSEVLEKLQEFEDFLSDKGIKKKKPYRSNKKQGLPRAKNNMDNFMYNEEYFSFLYDLVGKDAYVAGWCIEEYLE